jgi:hypothetical protein
MASQALTDRISNSFWQLNLRNSAMNKNKRLNSKILPALIGCSLALFVTSCASQVSTADELNQTPSSSADTINAQEAAQDTVNSTQPSGTETPANKTADGNSGNEQIAQAQIEDSGNPRQTSPQRNLIEECKKQPFVQYESQAHEYIKKGWEATQAQRFGVGFRNAEEYKKWTDTGNQLFAKVSELCVAMNDCAKQNKTSKEKKCAAEAGRFGQWQDLAGHFVEKVKSVLSTQPPVLCSLTPSADDSSQCFNLLADQIEQSCQTAECKEASACFRGVYILDDAINQAKLACSYVGQELSECRSYVEETGRRKAKFEQCVDKYQQLPMEILPVI